MRIGKASIPLAIVVALAACGDESKVPAADTVGPDPVLPEPTTSLIPTVNIAEAVGWPPDGMPQPADGLAVSAFAKGLDHPRWLYLLPNGDVLVAETNAPPKPDEGGGIRGWFFDLFQEEAGAAVPSANRITLLRDTDNDGVADLRTPFIQGLNSPFGMVLVGDSFYVANTDAVLRFDYRPGMTGIEGPGTKVADLPAGAEPPLDQEPDCEPRRHAALCHGRIEQQCGRERAGAGARSRRDPRDRSRQRPDKDLRLGPAQSQWPGLGDRDRRALDRGQ